MIVETVQHFLTPAPKHIKEMGYVKEAIAIDARHKRCADDWKPHLTKCKSLILAQVDKLASNSNIMILGSGALHDVPVEALISSGHTVTCVDIIHLPRVLKANKGLTFISRDVTGTIEPLYNSIGHDGRFLRDPEWELLEKPDLIVSLNLLSQLAMKMVEYAETHGEELGIQFADNILKEHVNWIRKQNTNSLLISDISRDYCHDGALLETVAALPDLGLGDPEQTWTWNIAPTGEADAEISISHNIGAWIFTP